MFLFKLNFQTAIESLSNVHAVECFWIWVSMEFSIPEPVFLNVNVSEQIFLWNGPALPLS